MRSVDELKPWGVAVFKEQTKAPISPLVAMSLFSMSVSLFLFCK